MKKLGKITNDRTAMILFILCWLVNAVSYIGRLNYSSAMADMIQEEMLVKSQAGFISMVYFFAYGIGQLCNGILGDRISPEKLVFTGLSMAALMNVLMGVTKSFFLMSLIWGINGYANSMVWPPIIRIFAEMLEKERKMKYCIDIVSSQVAGTLASYLISASMMWLFGWKSVFVAASVCLAAMAAVWKIGFERIEEESKQEQGDKKKEPTNKEKSFSYLLINGGLMTVIFPVVIHGMLKDGVTTWVPTYITETFLTSPSFSILVTMVLPIINLTGAYVARYVFHKCNNQEVKASALFFAVAGTALCGLWAGKGISIVLTILLLAVTTASMMAVSTLFINMLPLRFETQGRVSTVSGFLNSSSYLGAALSAFLIGVMVEEASWNVTIGSWVMLTGIAFAVCIIFQKRQIG